MPHPLRFSLTVLPDVPWGEFLRRCRRAEELGFDALNLSDCLVDFRGRQGPWFELWTMLSAVAMATRRIRLATFVGQIAFRNPALFALQAITADHISGGRLDLGLGTGVESDPSYRMMGIENWSAKERVARFGEYVELVHRLLTQAEVTHRGRYYRADAAALRPRPVQSPRPPLMIAAMGPVMLGHAARHADIWNSMSVAASFDAQLEETRGRVAAIDARCAAIGRDPASLRRSFLLFHPDSAGALPYYESAETFERMARQLIALGMSELALLYPSLERQVPVFEQIAREVLPALKATGGSGNPQQGVVIETSRLRLRACRDDDLSDLVALAGNWQVSSWLARVPHPYEEAHGRDWIAQVRSAHATGRPLSFAIALKETDRLIGGGGLDGALDDSGEKTALGYWLGQPYWGNGYAREAVAAVLEYGFRTLDLPEIWARTDPANQASQKVLLACGLTHAGETDLAEPTHHGATRVPLFRISRPGR